MKNQNDNKKFQVFIADDSAVVRERLVEMLNSLSGIEVIGQAQNVKEATDMIRDLHPDAVTLDINMPGGSGFDVLQTILSESNEVGLTPVFIMLSNLSHAPYRRKALNAGANFFFDKSTEFEQVKDILLNLAMEDGAHHINGPP